jgi:serine/threonine-protein kinase RsbW
MHEETMASQFAYTLSRQKNDQATLLDRIQLFAHDNALPEKLCYQLGLIVDELVTNSLVHGGCDDDAQPITVSIEKRQHDLLIEIIDTGIPFDPTSYTSTRCPADGSGPLGGVGLCLVQHLADSMHYSRRNNRNHLVISLDTTQ